MAMDSAAPSGAEHFETVLARGLTRREAIRHGILGSIVILLPWTGQRRSLPVPHGPGGLSFSPLPGGTGDQIRVAAGHNANVLLRWGDPILPGAPAFDPARQSVEAQLGQFGYNCDYVGYIPLATGSPPSQHGLLAVNHEYTIPELMFAGYDAGDISREQVDIQLAAHGMSFVEVHLDVDGRWQVNRSSRRNWRLTGLSPTLLSGPVAGHPWVRTGADPSGTQVIGTLGNCSASMTPWGTVLTAEENFQVYFGDRADFEEDDPRFWMYIDYGVPLKASQYRFEEVHRRFSVQKEPGESFRFGYVVEVDPLSPSWTPRKRTAMGRIRREGASLTVARSGQVVLYSGDDIVFEHVYKFVTRNAWRPTDRAHNLRLLDEGTIYAARFNDDGTGDWMPLVAGRGPLVGDNGFPDQAHVCLYTIRAAELMGATRMDRPEDIEVHPHTGKVYIALTKNPMRGDLTLLDAAPNAANPRINNQAGHIIELEEAGGDHSGTRFRWRVFLLCGDPADPTTYFAGFPRSQVSALACPDNLTFDLDGNLWVATDGQPATLGQADALYAIPTEGPERGRVRRFLTGVPGSEITGPCFTPDCSSLFVAIQHPGEGGTLGQPISAWPDGSQPPRPAVVAIRADDGRQVGTAPA